MVMEEGMRFNTLPGCLTLIELGVAGVYAFAMLHITVCNSQNRPCTPVCCHLLFEIRKRDITRDKFETLFLIEAIKLLLPYATAKSSPLLNTSPNVNVVVGLWNRIN